MITLSLSEMAYEAPKINPDTMFFYGFWTDKIEEFNLKIDEEIQRAYRIHWTDNGKKKCFDCVLHGQIYERVVVPNISRVEVMSEK
jgi:hypothetical protein